MFHLICSIIFCIKAWIWIRIEILAGSGPPFKLSIYFLTVLVARMSLYFLTVLLVVRMLPQGNQSEKKNMQLTSNPDQYTNKKS